MTVALVMGTFVIVALIAVAMIAVTSYGSNPAARATERAPDRAEEAEAQAGARARRLR